ncbi:MAG: GntR family transcriptional regulator [Prolixibacteraceae bacterium]
MIQHSDLSLPVYEELKQMILTNQLKPGEKLLQEKLAAQLGVSRTPLLKAMQMLEFDYLVESVPRRGMFVKKLTIQEMHDIYDVREGIETVAVRLVIQRADENQIKQLQNCWHPFTGQKKIEQVKYQKTDDNFHAMLLEFSGNKVLEKTYRNSFLQARIVQMGIMRPPEETLPEHLDLVNAIANRDLQKADSAIKNHLRRSKASIETNFKKT